MNETMIAATSIATHCHICCQFCGANFTTDPGAGFQPARQAGSAGPMQSWNVEHTSYQVLRQVGRTAANISVSQDFGLKAVV
jgi:hypothetical protein